MELTLLLLGLVAIFNFAMVSATALPDNITTGGTPETLPTSPMIFEGEVGGHQVSFNGTIQEVYVQAEALHPGIDLDALLAPQNTTLAPRAALNKDGLLCCPIAGQSWSSLGGIEPLYEGIAYLNTRSSYGVNANSCARVSCSWNAAIFLCNDNPYPIAPAGPYIASYAGDIITACSSHSICGQEFDSDNYNVIVRWDKC